MGFTSLKANQLVTSPINYKSVTAHSCACLLDKLAVQNRETVSSTRRDLGHYN